VLGAYTLVERLALVSPWPVADEQRCRSSVQRALLVPRLKSPAALQGRSGRLTRALAGHCLKRFQRVYCRYGRYDSGQVPGAVQRYSSR
jgi:hypothetical protein